MGSAFEVASEMPKAAQQELLNPLAVLVLTTKPTT